MIATHKIKTAEQLSTLRSMNPAERNHGPGEQELLATMHSLRVRRCYLEGRHSRSLLSLIMRRTHSCTLRLCCREGRLVGRSLWSASTMSGSTDLDAGMLLIHSADML